ncbi:unnamed protein product [Urochloa humidicola]
MKVKLQARQMWEAVKYGGVAHHEDRRALEALVAAVPSELGVVLATKRTTKDAWKVIATARIGSEHARWSSLQKLRQEWDRLAFQPGEDVDNFALRLSNLMQRLRQFGDEDITEEKAVEKLLRAVPPKYRQIALAVQTMLDLSTMTIEDVAGRLKAFDDQDEEAPGGAINIRGRLYYTEESWLALQKEQKKGEATGSVSDRPHGSRKKNNKIPHPRDGPATKASARRVRTRTRMTPVTSAGRQVIGPGTARREEVALKLT